MKLKSYHTDFIKTKALELGFISCGISKSGFLQDEIGRYENWLKNNYHGKMSYMERNFDKRLDTTKLVEGSKSVISLLYNYYPKKKINSHNNFKISKYAYGKDYHFIIKKKLKSLNVDKFGLDEMDNKILTTLIKKFNGQPVGINTLSTAVSETAETIEEVYEPFLIQEGFLTRTPRGRQVTKKAYQHLDVSQLNNQKDLFD